MRAQGMVAGENTLNALCARVVTRGIAAKGRCVPSLSNESPKPP